MSFHAYAYLTDRYVLLPHGASMGDRYGPIVVSKKDAASLKGITVAIPGTLTTAFLTLRLFDPSVQHVVLPFDRIQEAVHAGDVEAGLLIHEGQLTWADEGLKKIVDLGEWWADRTGGLPLPLGGNVIRRDLGSAAIASLSRLLHDSIAYGLDHRDEAVTYSMQFGRGLDRPRTDRFVGMYVNDLTLDYGDRGREAVKRLLGDAYAAGLLPKPVTSSSLHESWTTAHELGIVSPELFATNRGREDTTRPTGRRSASTQACGKSRTRHAAHDRPAPGSRLVRDRVAVWQALRAARRSRWTRANRLLRVFVFSC